MDLSVYQHLVLLAIQGGPASIALQNLVDCFLTIPNRIH